MPSRLYTASAGYVTSATEIITGYPCSLFAWIRPTTLTGGNGAVIAAWNNSSSQGLALECINGFASMRARQTDNTTDGKSVSTAYALNQWAATLAVFRSGTSRTVYGGRRSVNATSTVNRTTFTTNNFTVGRRLGPTPDNQFQGYIATPIAWDVADFTDYEIDQLLGGENPYLIRPESIIAAPALGFSSPEPDLFTGRSWTVSGTTASVEGPPINMRPVFRRRFPPTVESLSATTVRAQVSVDDTWHEISIPITPDMIGKMNAVVVNLDDQNGVIGIEVNETGEVVDDVGGTWNTQIDYLLLGAGQTAVGEDLDLEDGSDLLLEDGDDLDLEATGGGGGAISAGDAKSYIHGAATYSEALSTDAARNRAWNLVADNFAPVIDDIEIPLESGDQFNVDILPYVRDPSGRGVSVTGVRPLDPGSLAHAAGSSAVITPLANRPNPSYVAFSVVNNWVRPRSRSGRIRLIKNFTSGLSPYNYRHSPQYLPDDLTLYDVWELPVTGGSRAEKGNTDRVLLIVAPEAPITGKVVADDLLYRGVIMIGATVRIKPLLNATTPAGKITKGSNTFGFSWNGDADWGDNIHPYLFLSNIDWAPDGTKWGDFLRVGGRVTGDGRIRNFDKWPDIYLQKIFIGTGHYAFQDTATVPEQGRNEPLSDIVVFERGGVRRLRVADCDFKWTGTGLNLGTQGNSGFVGHPLGDADIDNVVFRPMPADTNVYTGDGTRLPNYLRLSENPDRDFANGDFLETTLNNVYGQRFTGLNAAQLSNYFSPSNGQTYGPSHANNDVAWPAASYNGRRPVVGKVAFQDDPTAYVSADETGSLFRITDVGALKLLFSELILEDADPEPEIPEDPDPPPSPPPPPVGDASDPRAYDDFFSTSKNKAKVLNILANDDPGLDGDAIDPTTVAITRNPPTGHSVSVNPTSGAVTFTPKTNENNVVVSFGYTVDDTMARTSNEANVYVGIGKLTSSIGYLNFGVYKCGIPTWESEILNGVSKVHVWGTFPGKSANGILTGTTGTNPVLKRMNDDGILVSISLALCFSEFPGDFQRVIDGKADADYKKLTKNLKTNCGIRKVIFRLGWEAGHSSWPWSLNKDFNRNDEDSPQNFAKFKAAFQHVAALLKTEMPECVIDFNNFQDPRVKAPTTAQPRREIYIHPDEYYVGNEYCDIISVNAYNQSVLNSQSAVDTNFAETRATTRHSSGFMPNGMHSWYQYAISKGKPFAIPEWGARVVVGPGDNPHWIKGLHRYMTDATLWRDNFVYHYYFNADDSALITNAGATIAQTNASRLAYKATFGDFGTNRATDLVYNA